MANECDKVMAAIFAQPWAILPEWLDQVIAVAYRLQDDRELAAAIREERSESLALSRARDVAVIPVFGPIVSRGSWFTGASGATSIEHLSHALDDALNDTAVGSIVFNFDSPGGQVTGVHDFAKRIRESCQVKPITSFVRGMAASAAYWLASATDRIVSDRTAKVGSIGVVTAWTDDSAARKAQGLKDYVIVSSQSPNKYLDPKSPEGRNEIQDQVDSLAAIFMDEVAAFRGVTAVRVAADYGQGSVLLADAALAAGMIDAIGTLDDALFDSASNGQDFNREGKTMHVLGKAKNGNKAERDENDDEEDKKEDASTDEEKDEKENAKANDPDDKDETEEEATEEDDEDEEKDAKARKTAKALKSANPAAYHAVQRLAFKAGIANERRRLREIRALGIVGQHKLVEKAMFTHPMTAAELSMAYVKAENEARAAYQKGRLEESKEATVPVSLTDVGASGGDAAERQAIIGAMAGQARK